MPHPTPGETDYIQNWLALPKDGEPDGIREQINDALKLVFDPEIPINVYEVGLIWDYSIDGEGLVQMDMTLTSPNCPAAESLPVTTRVCLQAVCIRWSTPAVSST